MAKMTHSPKAESGRILSRILWPDYHYLLLPPGAPWANISSIASLKLWVFITHRRLRGLGRWRAVCLCLFLKQDFIYLFLDRGKWREKQRERNINVWLPFTRPLLGTWPTTQACTLTGNRTGNPLVCRLALSPLSHTSQGWFCLDHLN